MIVLYNIIYLSSLTTLTLTNPVPVLDKTNFKVMKKTICITPVDDVMSSWVEALEVLNQFKAMGFERREAFREVVSEYDRNYIDYRMSQKLNNFWALRDRSEFLVTDLRVVLEKLKAE